jgi:hypothetical protein
LDDGRYAQVTFEPAGRGRIRVLSILASDTDDEGDLAAWSSVDVDSIEREEMRYIISQLDLSEIELYF